MSETSNPTAPAGWYDDGTGTETLRYWDGAQWTDQSRSATAAAVPTPDAPAVAAEPVAAPSDPTKRAKPHVLSWIALGVAAVGFIFACIPGALIVGWVLLPIAFILSIVALFLKGKKWPAIAALIASVVGTIVGAIVFTSVVFESVDSVIKDSAASASSESVADDDEEAAAPSFAPQPEPEEELGNLAFGDAATFEDGVSISVSTPSPYTPSEYAAGADLPNNVAFTITVTNGSDANFDGYSYSTVTSGGQAGSHIFDNDMSGAPNGVILPGQTITWTEAWSVADPNSIVFQVAPSFDYEEVIFTNVP